MTFEAQAPACPACGEAVPRTANFCPSCGHRIAPGSDVENNVAYAHTRPRLFGVLSPVATFVLGCFLLLATLLAFLAGSAVLSIVLLAASAAVFVLFYGASERDPSNPIARGALTAKDRVREWATFATGSANAWTTAGREVVRLRAELRSLRRERNQVQTQLGGAAYREDEPAVASFRKRMQEIDDAIEERERARVQVLARARHQVEDERVAIHPTEVLAPDERERAHGPAESS